MATGSDEGKSETIYTKDVLDKLRNRIIREDVRFIFVVFSDFHTMERGKVIPKAAFLERIEEGILCSGMQLLRLPQRDIPPLPDVPLSVEFNDLRFYPDLKTFKTIPWRKNVAAVVADPYYPISDRRKVGFSPRHVARKMVKRLDECGYQLLSALEYEFCLLDPNSFVPIHNNETGHWVKNFFENWDLLTEMMDSLTRMGIEIQQLDSEGECSVYEFPIRPSVGLDAADDGFWLKKTVREIAQRRGYLASFSSKPFTRTSGLSGHFNHSLLDSKTGRPLFFDDDDPTNMSKIMKHWLAGLIRHAPAMVIFGCPTASCQRRFVYFDRATPRNSTWGIDNRTCSFRVKNYSANETYIENRIFGASCNPYLTLAVHIAAGLDGVLNELPLPAMTNGNAFESVDLPEYFSGKLSDAISALEEDEVICSALGKEFVSCYINAKRHECNLEATAIKTDDTAFYEREYLPYL